MDQRYNKVDGAVGRRVLTEIYPTPKHSHVSCLPPCAWLTQRSSGSGDTKRTQQHIPRPPAKPTHAGAGQSPMNTTPPRTDMAQDVMPWLRRRPPTSGAGRDADSPTGCSIPRRPMSASAVSSCPSASSRRHALDSFSILKDRRSAAPSCALIVTQARTPLIFASCSFFCSASNPAVLALSTAGCLMCGRERSGGGFPGGVAPLPSILARWRPYKSSSPSGFSPWPIPHLAPVLHLTQPCTPHKPPLPTPEPAARLFLFLSPPFSVVPEER